MKTLTVRNVPKRLADALNRERRRTDGSLNQVILDTLSRGLGVEGDGPRRNGLAGLAGTWNAEQHREFEAAVAALGAIDPEMWE